MDSLQNEYKSLDTVLNTAVLALTKLQVEGNLPSSLGLTEIEKFAVESSGSLLIKLVV